MDADEVRKNEFRKFKDKFKNLTVYQLKKRVSLSKTFRITRCYIGKAVIPRYQEFAKDNKFKKHYNSDFDGIVFNERSNNFEGWTQGKIETQKHWTIGQRDLINWKIHFDVWLKLKKDRSDMMRFSRWMQYVKENNIDLEDFIPKKKKFVPKVIVRKKQGNLTDTVRLR